MASAPVPRRGISCYTFINETEAFFMENDSKAIMLDNGLVVCESCGAELECNHETGDMPDVCPECGKVIDWSDFFMVL